MTFTYLICSTVLLLNASRKSHHLPLPASFTRNAIYGELLRFSKLNQDV